MDPAPLPPIATPAALLRRGKLNITNPPPGRFLYTIDGHGPWLEGRILERFDDPEHEPLGAWLRLADGPEWVWSKDVWVEVELPEAAGPEAAGPEAGAPSATSPRPSPPAEREKTPERALSSQAKRAMGVPIRKT